MQQRLEGQEETALNLHDTYSSLQQEVEVKTKKLKKVYCVLLENVLNFNIKNYICMNLKVDIFVVILQITNHQTRNSGHYRRACQRKTRIRTDTE